ncbi:uncharacterized protein LOC134214315 [Armigeres subalbatus]|uniref:uncharacterized protein LOC134214315 n=1 Tax=Armigeres subalbatus TaxID=124917 RepID=UPI002ED435B6
MKAIAKVIIFIAGVSLVACIVGAAIYIEKHGLPHTELFTLNAWKHNGTNQEPNDTSGRNGTTQMPNDTSSEIEVAEPTTTYDPEPSQETEHPRRTKRAIIFRPLFVYRQQQVKKQRLREAREERRTTTTTTRPRTQRPKYASNYPYMRMR